MGERAPEYGAPVPGHAAGRVAATRASSVWALTLPVWLNSCAIECAVCVMGYPAAFAGTWSVERGGGGVDVRQAAMDVRCLCECAGVMRICVCDLQPRMSTSSPGVESGSARATPLGVYAFSVCGLQP